MPNVNQIIDVVANAGKNFRMEVTPKNASGQTGTKVISPIVQVSNLGTFSNNVTAAGNSVTANLNYNQSGEIKYYLAEGDLTGLTDTELIERYNNSRINTPPNFTAFDLVRQGTKLSVQRVYEDIDGDEEDVSILTFRTRPNASTAWTEHQPDANGEFDWVAFPGQTAQAYMQAKAKTGFRSGPDRFTGFLSLPAQPNSISNLTADSILNTSAKISWTNPANTVIDNYKFTLGGAVVKTVPKGDVKTLIDGRKEYTLTGLTADTTYALGVVASNAVGDSPIVSVDITTTTTAPYDDSVDYASVSAGTSDRIKQYTSPDGGGSRAPYAFEARPHDYYNNPTKRFPLVISLGGDGELMGYGGTGPSVGYDKANNFGFLKRMVEDTALDLGVLVLHPIMRGYSTDETELATLVNDYIQKNLSRIDTGTILLTGLSGTGYGRQVSLHGKMTYKPSALVVLGKRNSLATDASIVDNVPIWFIVNEEGVDYNSTKSTYNELTGRANRSAETRLTVFTGTGHNSWVKAFNETPVTLVGGEQNNAPLNPPSVIDWFTQFNNGALPKITVNPVSQTLSVGDTYTPPTVTATDAEDGDLTASIQAGGQAVNTATPGTYRPTYSVTDSDGNTVTATHVVTVQEAASGNEVDAVYFKAQEADEIGSEWVVNGESLVAATKDTTAPVNSQADRRLRFNIETFADDYVVWIRGEVQNGSDDNTVFVAVDNSNETTQFFAGSGISDSSGMRWHSEHSTNAATTGNDYRPGGDLKLRYPLSQGAHTIDLYTREAMLIHGIYVTRLGDTPTDNDYFAAVGSGGGSSVPAAVTGLTGQATGTDGISLSWNAVSGATGYTIYRSASGANSFASQGNRVGNAFSQTGLTAETDYDYRVTAYNNAGEGPVGQTITVSTDAVSGGSGGGSGKVVGVNYGRYGEFVSGYHNPNVDPAVAQQTSANLPLKDGSGDSGWTHEIAGPFTRFFNTSVDGAPDAHPDGTTMPSGVYRRALESTGNSSVRFGGLDSNKAYRVYITGSRSGTFAMTAQVTVDGTTKTVDSQNNRAITSFDVAAGGTSIDVNINGSGSFYYLGAIELHEIA